MTTTVKTIITVEVNINAPVEKVWHYWTEPKHIVHWNHASIDWHTPNAENDVRPGGKFLWRMEARDGSHGFDFAGEFTRVIFCKLIEYTLTDGRKVRVTFSPEGETTTVTEAFEAEQTHDVELQKEGWQAILNNFKNYTLSSGKLKTMRFEISIHAEAGKVYRTMLDENGYSAWTAAFNPTSRFKGSWEKGSRIHFLGQDQDGSVGGMVSSIRENIPGKFVSIEHLGMIKDGKEVMTGPDVEIWAGAMENYTFTGDGGNTLLRVDADTIGDYESFFQETWPKALALLKSICEKD